MKVREAANGIVFEGLVFEQPNKALPERLKLSIIKNKFEHTLWPVIVAPISAYSTNFTTAFAPLTACLTHRTTF